MQIVKAGYQRVHNGESITKKIERIARTCYKSEELIGEGTDLAMLNKLFERRHLAMLEHASLAYIVPIGVYGYIESVESDLSHYRSFKEKAEDVPSILRLKYTTTDLGDEGHRYVVSANIRAWIEFFEYCVKSDSFSLYLKSIVLDVCEQTKKIVDFTKYVACFGTTSMSGQELIVNRVDDFSILTDAERMVHETISVMFTVDRGVTHELVRMRDCSFAQESTRYCNYSVGKYGNEITVIEPCFWESGSTEYNIWAKSCEDAELAYITLTQRLNQPAQKARDVLPTSVKADIVMTTNLQEWRHIFELRACDLTGPAHPQMKEVMCPFCREMQEEYAFAFGDLVVAD